jgi:hypothetical protein
MQVKPPVEMRKKLDNVNLSLECQDKGSSKLYYVVIRNDILKQLFTGHIVQQSKMKRVPEKVDKNQLKLSLRYT